MLKAWNINRKKMLCNSLRRSELLIAQLALLLLFSCTYDDNEVPSIDKPETPKQDVIVNVAIQAPAVSVSDALGHDDIESGSLNEYVVKRVDIYFFNSITKIIAKREVLRKIYLDESQDDKKWITYSCGDITLDEGNYDVFAVANSDNELNVVNEQSLLATIDKSTYSQGVIESTSEDGFVMTSRASSYTDIPIKVGRKNKLLISLERVVSKIEIGQSKNAYYLYNNGEAYAMVNLTNYKLVNLSSQFYLFRHVAQLNTFNQPTYELNTNFGNIPQNNGYVIDPYFFTKTDNASRFSNIDGYFSNALVDMKTYSNWSSLNVAGNYSLVYALENCMYHTSQKNAYTTGIIFKAAVYPNNNVYKWDTEKQCLVLLENKSDWTTPLYFYNYKFYTSLSALKASGATVDTSLNYTDSELLNLGIKRIKKNNGTYECYYNYWIKHLDNGNPNQMGVMEYGIVRNNVYRLQVATIGELGYGTLAILPNQNDEPISYIDTNSQVEDWVVSK